MLPVLYQMSDNVRDKLVNIMDLYRLKSRMLKESELDLVHTYRLKSWESDTLPFIGKGTWLFRLVPPAEMQRSARCPVALQGKAEKRSALCKCPLTQCKRQPGKSLQKQMHRVIYFSAPVERGIACSTDTVQQC